MLGNIWKTHDSSPWQFINWIQILNQSPWFKSMAILSMEFKSIIKAHGVNSWQFIYQKPNSHWQYQNPIHIGNIKSPILIGNIKSPFHIGNIIKSPILIGNIKSPIYISNIKNSTFIGNIKTQFSLAISKVQFTLAVFYQKPKVINTWQNTIL